MKRANIFSRDEVKGDRSNNLQILFESEPGKWIRGQGEEGGGAEDACKSWSVAAVLLESFV